MLGLVNFEPGRISFCPPPIFMVIISVYLRTFKSVLFPPFFPSINTPLHHDRSLAKAKSMSVVSTLPFLPLLRRNCPEAMDRMKNGFQRPVNLTECLETSDIRPLRAFYFCSLVIKTTVSTWPELPLLMSWYVGIYQLFLVFSQYVETYQQY